MMQLLTIIDFAAITSLACLLLHWYIKYHGGIGSVLPTYPNDAVTVTESLSNLGKNTTFALSVYVQAHTCCCYFIRFLEEAE